ncbi:MAG: PqqD family peptide modification chaperone [Gammaproteobacteria bacterium]
MSAPPAGVAVRRLGDYAPSERDALAAAIAAFARLFQDEFGLSVYLTWGTLLGAVREGDFIAHDLDVDLAYLSAARSDYEVVEEHELIVRVLAARGLAVRPASRGQMHVDVAGARDRPDAFDLDIWTTWVRDGRYYHYPDIKGELPADAVVPLVPRLLRQAEVLAPARPEALLDQFYGADWRTPDPGYAWYPRYHGDDVFEFLRAPRAAAAVPRRPRRVGGLNIAERDGCFLLAGGALAEPQRLNATAMLVLELCSGERDVADIVLAVQGLYGLDGAPEVAVLDFLAHAAATGLVDDAADGP